VLYLQHGWGEDETAWIAQGRANLIMDNIGLLNGGTISSDDVKNTPDFATKVKLVFVSYGSREPGGGPGGGRGGFGGNPKANAEALKQAGINSAFYVSQDTAHEFQSWRRSLRELAPLLFKE
jgi:hypothetical protein